PEGWGPDGNNQGKIFVTVAGKDFYDHSVLSVKGLLAWVTQEIHHRFGTAVYLIMSYPHPQKGWIETRINYRIIQDDKIMKVAIFPQEKIVQPGAEQIIKFNVSDHKGKPANAELAVAVVDEAVLALQPEFRPSLMDFFYPMDRLNLMSFYSTQFQSYGYGEYLAKQFRPNVYLATNKDRDALKEKDTAYWNGHVVTDESGKAQVQFAMPGNMTTWKVIVSAVDKEGRFGEQIEDFKSKMFVEAIFSMQYFLRVGDSAQARLTLSNIKPDTVAAMKVGYHVTSGPGIILDAGKEGESSLKFKEEHHRKIEIKTDLSLEGKKSETLNLDLSYDQKKLNFPHTLLLRSGYESLPVNTTWTDNKVFFKLSSEEKIRDVQITLMQGLSGALGPSLQWLIAYPYGCVEQLVNTTIPNLAIFQTYKALKEIYMKSKIKAASLMNFLPTTWYERVLKNFRVAQFFIKYEVIPPAPGITVSKEFDDVLEKANRFSESGLAKLQANMMPNGSFAWFPDSDLGDASMTLHVLLSVSMVQNWDSISSFDVKKIYRYLRGMFGNEAIRTENILLNFVASRLYAWGQAVDGPQQFLTQIKLQADYALEKGSIIEMSYLLMAIKNFNYSNEGGMERIRKALEEKVYQNVLEIVDHKKEFDPKVWLSGPLNARLYQHLGRDASAVATAANALALWGKSDAAFAKKVGSYLMKKFNGNHYGSTYETAHI
ncbi:MAG: alpha-2-macroglobulin family protein, partial [Bdellovibrionota bacterium]